MVQGVVGGGGGEWTELPGRKGSTEGSRGKGGGGFIVSRPAEQFTSNENVFLRCRLIITLHFLPPLDLLCLRSSRSKYNASTIHCLLVLEVRFFLVHFDLKHWFPAKALTELA